MNGILNIDKPKGITSHDVISFVRRKFKMKRVGHAGTLDPLATGVLVLLLGKATKLFSQFELFDKAYASTLLLGTTTNSADIQGKILSQKSYENITQNQIEMVLRKFEGDIEQIPPMVSAIKIGGIRLYKLARKGIEVSRKPRKIRIDILKLISFTAPEVKIYLECSKGTYVRQLAEDIGQLLKCGACITEIRRIKVGPFHIDDAVHLDDINEHKVKKLNDRNQFDQKELIRLTNENCLYN